MRGVAAGRGPAVQVYKAEGPHWPVRVYNLLYEDSQEADKFAAAVAREVWLLLTKALCCPLSS